MSEGTANDSNSRIILDRNDELTFSKDQHQKVQSRSIHRYIQGKEVFSNTHCIYTFQLRKQHRKEKKLRRLLCSDLHLKNELKLTKSKLMKTSMADSLCRTRVVIDCAYDSVMSFKDICKLCNQICLCYGANRRSKLPVQLFITGLGMTKCPNTAKFSTTNEDICLYDRLKICGCDNWDLNLCQEDFSTLFPASSIVYLCAESEDVLPNEFVHSSSPDSTKPNFTLDDVYVIGGLVDHNHHLGFCFKQAITRGFRTARLPLEESNVLIMGRKILSTFHVFDSLCPVLNGTKTWTESFQSSIPPRKLKF